MDPDSKHVRAVQLPLGWMYNILSDVLQALSPEGIPRTRKGSCASLPHTNWFWQDSIPSFLPLLTQCIFMALLSIEYLPIHLQWCTTPHARMEDASYITSEELNWSKALYQFLWNYITNYILQFLLPHLSHCPFPPETHSHIQTPDSRIVHAIHSQKIPGLP